MSSDLSPTEPYLRYTRTATATPVRGWLVKEGKKTKKSSARYMRLDPISAILSNHRDNTSESTWGLSLTHATVTVGHRPLEIIVHFSPTSAGTNNHETTSIGRRLSLFAPKSRDFRRWLFALRSASTPTLPSFKLEAFYSTGEVIGDGINGDVLSGRDRLTGDDVAIKSLPLDDGEDGGDARAVIAMTEEEIAIAVSLNHPNLVRTYDVFRDSAGGKVHMVMEYVAGGELRDRVDTPDGTTVRESEARSIAHNLLNALDYLHGRGIVHRDVKLENVLCVSSDESLPVSVKLADFGSSTTVSSQRQQLNTAVGTGYYLAPEIVEERPYGTPVDLWALGVLMYITLSSKLPFLGIELDDYLRNVIEKEVDFPPDDWKGLSEDAQRFIQRLMEKDPERRMTAKQGLQHPWLSDMTSPIEVSNTSDVEVEGDASATATQGNEGAMLHEGPKSLLFGKRRTAADIVSRKKERRERQMSSTQQAFTDRKH